MAAPNPPRDSQSTESLTRTCEGVLNAVPDGIAVVDSAGRMLLANTQLAGMFGYAPGELTGVEVEVLMPEALRGPHQLSRERYEARPKICVMASGRDLMGRRKDSSEFAIEVSLSPLRTPNELLVIASVRDVSVRRNANAELRSLLDTSNLLRKELHHRTKNNLQVMSSLLNLRKTTIADPDAAAALEKTRDQVRAMALVHDLLWQAESRAPEGFQQFGSARVNLQEYGWRLIEEIQHTHDIDPALVRFHTHLERVDVSFDTATRLGLIVNELISNSLEHAFPEGSGDVTVTLTRSGDGASFQLTVADNGIGLPPDLAERRQQAMGLQLVESLVEQSGGTIAVDGAPGTTVAIRLSNLT
ncbi:MAG: PAS domain S-box protein [Vicinamibacterales bacterium]|jgi:PAS domain S-box-containing protein